MMKILRFVFFCASCVSLFTACANPPPVKSQMSPPSSYGCYDSGPDGPSYRIGPGDVLRISVWNDKSLERTVTVRPDGMISFPLLNDLRAAGSSPMQLQQTMDSGLRQFINDPQVSVVVQAVNSFTVSVLGEVNKPGRYEMHSGRATVLDALALAGGLTPYARRSGIHLLRHAGRRNREIAFHYGRAISDKPEGADFCVAPGDIIIVP